MNMKEIKVKAKTLGIEAGKMKKMELVRAIQVQEGYSPCFQSSMNHCEQNTCCWRSDCLH